MKWKCHIKERHDMKIKKKSSTLREDKGPKLFKECLSA